ncbi:SspB family protein [Kordiimonas pumila]|uniref:SspB family protein n=1 Tax=Kordiimonas pumila TaxID=2161677 RepID=A0ABV7D9U1_9PROT|nr:ClpXP protease specificity-enhancing factor SspB [Kordiimonas pumila]
MSEAMADSHIDYDAKVQNALRQVVRSVLKDTEADGLMGDHHFYVAFKTQADGVDIPAHLVSRFPDEMTIVVQHKFWGLKVHDDYFEIGLSFNQKPEHLTIPFDAIVGFVDPSVQFALQFHEDIDYSDDMEPEEIDFSEPTADSGAPQDKQGPDDTLSPDAKTDTVKSNGSDNIVTLDAFRRK